MDDGELDFSYRDLSGGTNMGELPSSCSMGSFFDEILTKDTHQCTHTHTCNPPGPDYSHTHTCFHVHTKIVPAPTEEGYKVSNDDTGESSEKRSKKHSSGNREAVRKYREKKKARAASLEDEVVKLRTLNQQLLKRLQGQAVLEAEIARLKCLLVDIGGRIDGEIGSFPYQKSASNVNLSGSNLPGAYVMNPCNVQCKCNDQVYCLHPAAEGKSGDDLQCLANQNSGGKDLSSCGFGGTVTEGNSSATNKYKG